MNIYLYKEYKHFVNDYIDSNASEGRGAFKRIAEHLRVHPTLVSQIFKGERQLSLEQAFDLCDYLKLDGPSRQYFMTMVEFDRAGTTELKKYFEAELKRIKKDGDKLELRLDVKKQLLENDKAIYYSDAVYSKVRSMISLEKYSVEQMAKRLRIKDEELQVVIDFLIRTGLVVKKGNSLQIGETRTHLEKGSPYLRNHHRNWRLQSIQNQTHAKESDMFYTGVMSVSDKDYHRVKERLEQALADIYKDLASTEAEVTTCLNIDFFKW